MEEKVVQVAPASESFDSLANFAGAVGRKEQLGDLGRETWFREYLGQVIDEMGAADGADPRNLFRPG
jgi:hypothetical protein